MPYVYGHARAMAFKCIGSIVSYIKEINNWPRPHVHDIETATGVCIQALINNGALTVCLWDFGFPYV